MSEMIHSPPSVYIESEVYFCDRCEQWEKFVGGFFLRFLEGVFESEFLIEFEWFAEMWTFLALRLTGNSFEI